MKISLKQCLFISFASIAIWLPIISLISLSQYRQALRLDQQSSFLSLFSTLFPWYASWIWFTPLLVILIKRFLADRSLSASFALKHLALASIFFPCYLLSAGGLVFVSTGELAGSMHFLMGMEGLIQQNYWAEDIIIYLGVVLGAYVSVYLKEIRIQEQKNVLLQSQLYKVQLDALKSQLNPHFLFNALNTISGLMRMKSVEKATDAIAELSFMLRCVLERRENMVSVKEELLFIEKYIFFQTLRFEERLSAKMIIDDQAKNLKMPFLLLHTLVENAVKHGAQEDGNLNAIIIKAFVSEERLKIELRNNIASQHKGEGFGIGLINCQKRLDLIYKDNFLLSCDKHSENEYVILINLPAEPCNV